MCDYINISEKGLKQHKRMKHKDFEVLRSEEEHNNSLNISDVVEKRYMGDQNISTINSLHPCPLCKYDDNYCCCGVCNECEYLITEEGLSIQIMNHHEPFDVLATLGQQWVRLVYGTISQSPPVIDHEGNQVAIVLDSIVYFQTMASFSQGAELRPLS